jgi:2-iminobutanoate/2-iminopropanoate deaminase
MKKIIATENAPGAIGPYSQGIEAHGVLYCSGQIALDPKSGELVGETTVEQCEQILKNLGAVVKAAGMDYTNIVKASIHLTDMNDFAAVNEAYGKYFESEPPARSAIGVASLPRGAKIMIDAIAAS